MNSDVSFNLRFLASFSNNYMSAASDTNSDNLLTKRPVPPWMVVSTSVDNYNRLEDLYQTHVTNISCPKTMSHTKVQKSFKTYMTFVYDLLKLGPLPESFDLAPSVSQGSQGGLLSNQNSLSQDVSHHSGGPHPVDPKAVSLDDMANVVQHSADMQIFRVVMLKIMCDEQIFTDDIERLGQAKLFNLKKLIFIKFKRVIETKWPKK